MSAAIHQRPRPSFFSWKGQTGDASQQTQTDVCLLCVFLCCSSSHSHLPAFVWRALFQAHQKNADITQPLADLSHWVCLQQHNWFQNLYSPLTCSCLMNRKFVLRLRFHTWIASIYLCTEKSTRDYLELSSDLQRPWWWCMCVNKQQHDYFLEGNKTEAGLQCWRPASIFFSINCCDSEHTDIQWRPVKAILILSWINWTSMCVLSIWHTYSIGGHTH